MSHKGGLDEDPGRCDIEGLIRRVDPIVFGIIGFVVEIRNHPVESPAESHVLDRNVEHVGASGYRWPESDAMVFVEINSIVVIELREMDITIRDVTDPPRD